MKILRIEIAAFGKWRQKSFDFYSGNQLIYGGNEAGKSTIYQFIQAILFGFPSKGRKKRIIHQKTAQPMAAKYGLNILYMVNLLSSATSSKIAENRRCGWGIKWEVMSY